ncbi:synaptosomal-associated protein 29-like [Stegodyphus dumicola]|uniref:synaptosomal-associated protein 29-like n=1 Tax=Stegodyphus dumicola TaxID=202533 RepID=UPI0015B0CB04|nr:synaptosomal-associated protein 29-like [Stegodyphus dumicola]
MLYCLYLYIYLQSIFGGLKNYFSKGGSTDPSFRPPTAEISSRKHSSTLQDTVENLKTDTKLSEASHPALRVRDLSFDESDSFQSNLSKPKTLSPSASSGFSSNIEEKLDKNLEFMSLGLGRLKNLAIGLNEEIEQQNEMIDVIHNKADKADETLEYQNRQIKRILKK